MFNVVFEFEQQSHYSLIESFGFDKEIYLLSKTTPVEEIYRLMQKLYMENIEYPVLAMLAVTRAGETRFFPVREVYYIESFGKIKSIMCAGCSFEFYGTLDEIEKNIVQFNFLRVSKSYIISIYNIKKACNRSVIMKDDKEINVGRKYFREYHKIVFNNRRIQWISCSESSYA